MDVLSGVPRRIVSACAPAARRRPTRRPSSRCRGASCAASSSGSPTRTPRTATPSPASPPSAPRRLPTHAATSASSPSSARCPTSSPARRSSPPGWWRNDPKHGWQFQALDYRTTLPATLQGMKRYLGSGLVKGIGPVMAGRIVDAFGGGDLRRHRRRPGAPDRGAGDRPDPGRSDRRHLGRAAPHPRGDGGPAGLRHLDLAGGAHLQAVRRRQRAGDRPGAVPPGPRGLGHRLQDGRQDRPGGRHRPRRPRAAPGRRAARAWGRPPTRATRCCRRQTSSSRRPRCSGPRRQPIDRGDHGPRRDRRAGRGDHRWRRGRRAQRLLALAPFARAESGLASRLQALHAAAGRTAARPGLRRRRLGRRLRLAGRAPRPAAGPRAGGGGADGADLARRDPHRRAGHGQDPHPAGRPDRWPRPSGCAACWPPRPGGRPSG